MNGTKHSEKSDTDFCLEDDAGGRRGGEARARLMRIVERERG